VQEVQVGGESLKKSILVLLTVSLAALAIVPAACDKGTDPGPFSSYSLDGASFSYPAEWTDGTADLEQSMAEDNPDYNGSMSVAGWYSPSGSATLLFKSIDLQNSGMPDSNTMTESDKESIVESMTGSMTAAMDQPAIVSQEAETISGQWAWQVEFSGEIEGLSAKGYLLTVISNDTILVVLYAGQNNAWISLGSVYDMVKASIVM
jgi:hypothetical protein